MKYKGEDQVGFVGHRIRWLRVNIYTRQDLELVKSIEQPAASILIRKRLRSHGTLAIALGLKSTNHSLLETHVTFSRLSASSRLSP